MSGAPVERRRGSVTATLAAAGKFLLEPAEPVPAADLAVDPPPRPVLAVFGLAPRCGATVVSRALAAELAVRDPLGAAVVTGSERPGGLPLGTPAAARLARRLAPKAAARATGRLCLFDLADATAVAAAVGGRAPVVLDAGRASVDGAAAAVAERVVLVATAAVEPALAALVAEAAANVGAPALTVLNRARPGVDWAGHADAVLPDARMGAMIALAGREPPGALGGAVAALADGCVEAR
jgi:hypothetical protein